MVGTGRQRVSTASGASGAAGLPERRLVGSGRQCVQAAASAVPAELRGRAILESGFQRLPAAWRGLVVGSVGDFSWALGRERTLLHRKRPPDLPCDLEGDRRYL